jgi:hypothetical protein
MSAHNMSAVKMDLEVQKGKRGWRIIPEDADVRLLLAIGFSILFGLTVAAAIIIPFFVAKDPKTSWETMKEVLSILLPAETGLLGSILGFYFGTKANIRDSDRAES